MPWQLPAIPKNQQDVLGYVANYIAGTAIFDGRIKKDDGLDVAIRFKVNKNNCKPLETTLGTEFVRRFPLHIVPRGVNRVRYAGLFILLRRQSHTTRSSCQLIESKSGLIGGQGHPAY
jgi:hypothetical protein